MQGTGKKVGDWIVKDRWGWGNEYVQQEIEKPRRRHPPPPQDLFSDLRSSRCPRLLRVTLIVNFSHDHFNLTLFEQADRHSLL